MLDAILSLPNGAHFYRVDLHNHTPADPSFHCLDFSIITEDEKKAFAQAYVHYARENQGLDIIGVTDHNETGWIKYIQEAAEDTGLIVLPGVELGANEGKRQVHYLALFDPGTDPVTIDHFISSLGLLPNNRFTGDSRIPRLTHLSCRQLTDKICATEDGLPGLAIAAHATRKNGLLHELEGEGRVIAYEDPNLIAIEIPGAKSELSGFYKRLVNGEADHYGRKSVACLNSSDGRGLGQVNGKDRLSVGDRFTRVKLSHVSINALRHALIDHDSRVRLGEESADTPYPRLLGLQIDNGFLCGPWGSSDGPNSKEPFQIHFNPNLNTIIGGRGTGKSTLLEAIRFVFDILPRTDATQAQAAQAVSVTLKDARVTAFYETADGVRYQIQRRPGHDPSVTDLMSGERVAVHPRQLLSNGVPLEVYGQKEVYEIANDVNFQLNLIDTYISEKLADLQRRESELIRRLKTNAQEILQCEDELADVDQQLLELPAVNLQLSHLSADTGLALLESKKQFEQERYQLEQLVQAAETRLAFAAQLANFDELPTEPDAFSDLRRLIQRLDTQLKSGIEQLEAELRAIWIQGEQLRSDWQAAYAANEAEYEEYAAGNEAAFSLDRFLELQVKQLHLQKLDQHRHALSRKMADLAADRRQMLIELGELRSDQISALRQQKAEELTQSLQEVVRVTLTPQGNRKLYAEALQELLNQRTRRGITRKVIETLAAASDGPISLAAAIRAERDTPGADGTQLDTVYGLSSAYRKRLAAVDDETLFELELYRIPDLPDIALKVGESYRSLTPPPGVAGLSMGQKCTAVLSIILVERDTPLVIDQPEDDLDNAFIFSDIVQTLRREKERRQFVIATHNANIPVSGDAEQILLMRANQTNGWIAYAGSIDDPEIRSPVENILEGGREAFRLRQSKYNI